MNKSEKLIACLEGEIAKRDEELAACRVAVENCEVFRARIADLEADRDSHQRCAIQAMAELAAIKAQEPVIDAPYGGILRIEAGNLPDSWVRINPCKLYAAPVSEAKAQGVVMPERWNVPRPMWKDARQPYGNPLNHADIEAAEKFNLALDEVARLNAAPVQQVSVPDEMRSLAQRLREYNQNPHHINPMSEAFHILVADAANAISTACVPKEIAAAITWSEHLLFECGALTSTRAPSVHVYNKTFAAVNEARAMLAAAQLQAAPAERGFVRQETNFVASTGEGRNPLYEGQFDDETPEQAAHRLHWSRTAMEVHSARLSPAPAAPAADAGLVDALGYQVLFDAIAAATSVYANGAVNISVQAFRDALAAHRSTGVV